MKVLLGSTNPGKIAGAKKAFQKYFKDVEIVGMPVSSGVSEEPLNKEIYKGASNRVNNLIQYAYEHNIDADYYLGIESGITNVLGRWMIVNVAVIKNKVGLESFGTSSGFPVPNKYVEEIINTDLAKLMDKLFAKHDLRSNEGGISHLTDGKITRIDLTEEAFIMALTTFINKDIWSD